MDLPSLIRFSSWLIPIPFMILYHIKTKKFNSFLYLSTPLIGLLSMGLFIYSLFNTLPALGFQISLIAFYAMSCSFAFILFQYKYEPLQALALSVCLTFFASAYWEIPYWLYTIYIRGYIDQSMPLHLLYFFPLTFVTNKIQVKLNWKVLSLVGISMLVSTVSIFYLLNLGADIFWTYTNPPILQQHIEIVWFVVRTISFVSLYYIYYHGETKK